MDRIEVNSRPLLLKRFIADGFDAVCIFILMLLVAAVIESTPIASTYLMHRENYISVEQEVLKNNDPSSINDILLADEYYQDEVFAANLHHYLLVILELFITEFILFLLIPLFNPDRSSLGKIMCGIMPFDESRQRSINRFQMSLRFIYLFFESIILYPWTGIYTILLIPVLRFIVMMLNRKNRTLQDILSGTMLIEKISYRSFE